VRDLKKLLEQRVKKTKALLALKKKTGAIKALKPERVKYRR